ncbi:uncharacterized protein CEXT_147151 [Caerostris extrusa]|uniref:Uncharacterized protein n=1 Tax=Caerostris extrusa TaxID=172846 RepID=A0AAV4Y2C7_CAEEX|nr:uncharacterized protein CEXT_147151 [Caerostris extrusa]
MGSDDGSVDLDLLDDTDEDRKMTRLTRNNTEFNASNKNLLQNNDLPPKNSPAPPAFQSNNTPVLLSSNTNGSSKIVTHNLSGNSVDRVTPALQSNINNSPPLQSVNNNKNNNVSALQSNNKSNRSPSRSYEKPLANLTYNDIQQDKKLNQYYFSDMEPLKSYLHNSSVNVNVTKTHHDHPTDNNNCRKFLNDSFSPLNTRTYSFVSEVSKNNNVLSSEHSSDSDYSTCRLTAGDSTDSESFQDAEDSRLLPCSSFLHGNYPRGMSQPALSSLESEKKYDGGSSTSGDVSNLSDDSDAIDCQEKTPYRLRNIRMAFKNSQVDSKEKKHSGENVVTTDIVLEKKVDVCKNSVTNDPCEEKTKEIALINTQSSEESPKQQTKKSNGSKLAAPPAPENCSRTEDPDPNPPVDVNLRNIIAVNGRSEPLCPTESRHPPPVRLPENRTEPQQSPEKPLNTVHQKSVLTPKHMNNDEQQQTSFGTPETNTTEPPKPQSLSPDETVETPDNTQDFQNISKDGSDDETISNRQSKLAALALELELARRDSAMRSAKMSPAELSSKQKPSSINISNENYPVIKKSATTCMSRLVSSTLPDVLVQTDTPTKTKKNRFSLKKLLKRNKESGTFAPAANPKAWKKQSFDRNRLSLEIVHPMDLTSGDSTPTDDYSVSGHPGCSRARSLSALPQLSGSEDSGCSLLDCRKVDTLPTRKAGTVAERKKAGPPLVRTPSCSALPNIRPLVAKDPPPKPPPPPKAKAMHPPPPPPPPHAPRTLSTPARPPPPKIPESRSRAGDPSKPESQDPSSADKEYANLGDIRSLLTPKKPGRPSAHSAPPRGEMEGRRNEGIYETLKEEDHYTYLDEVKAAPKVETAKRPWLDLQTSYAAIAAANYESLAEIVSSSMSVGLELFPDGGKNLKWKDFSLDSDSPLEVLHDKSIYNATYRSHEMEFMLLVTPRKHSTPQNARNLTPRLPVLASFTDYLPDQPHPPSPYMDWASVYVLRRSPCSTVQRFAQRCAAQQGEQHLHLRDLCFVLLQLIHSLKALQAEGVEEVGCDLDRLVLVETKPDRPPVLVLFPEDRSYLTLSEERRTLCQATLSTLCHFLGVEGADDLDSCEVNGERLAPPVAHTFKAIASVLVEEKASSLSQAKGFLEYMLWGPVDVKVQDCQSELDTVLQRWLDLQRAQMVKSTIAQLQNSQLHVYEEYQLVFLLQASVKSLKCVISKL